jgi:hypothetical protein
MSIKRMVTAAAVTATLGGATLVAAPAALADNGSCGYYSESRAVNSTSFCANKVVQSQVKAGGKINYGPWARKGETSWQRASYANVEWYTYAFHTV